MPDTAMAHGQQNRVMEIKFFGAGPSHGLVLEGFECSERLSGLFHLDARLSTSLSPKEAEVFIQPQLFVGKRAAIRLDLPDGRQRHFCGVVTNLARTGRDDERLHYSVEIAPWLWLLSKTSDCRVFQNKTVVEIVQEVVDELGRRFSHLLGSDLKIDIQTVGAAFGEDGNHSRRDICVQFNETTLDFILRLLEEEGICFYFEHDEAACRMVLADDPAKHAPCPHQPSVRLVADSGRHEDEPSLLSWADATSLTSGAHALRDHHFEEFSHRAVRRDARSAAPEKGMLGNNGELEIYEYGEGFAEPFNNVGRAGGEVLPEGDRRARWRMEAETAQQQLYSGTSTCAALSPGFTFHFDRSRNPRQPEHDPAGPFLLTEVIHSARQPASFATGEPAALTYHNRFQCIPVDVPFRPRRSTPRPLIYGVQTARVVGPDPEASHSGNGNGEGDAADGGEEIYVDKYGRVKVKFHWDRTDHEDDRCSAWIRVGQFMASAGFGAHFWPRVGDEVILAFENGDPDRPLVVGSVYNSVNMPPYELPAEKTKSGIKTKSTKLGDVKRHYNEIRFEDKKGSEQIYVHAERDFDAVIEHNETRAVGKHRRTKVEDGEILRASFRRIFIDGESEELEASYDGVKYSDMYGVVGNREFAVSGDEHRYVNGTQREAIGPIDSEFAFPELEPGTVHQRIVAGGADREVRGDDFERVTGEQGSIVNELRVVVVGGDPALETTGSLNDALESFEDIHYVMGSAYRETHRDDEHVVGGDRATRISGDDYRYVGGEHWANCGSIMLQADTAITLKVGPNSLKITPAGITLNGLNLMATAQLANTITAPINNLVAQGPLSMLAAGPLNVKGAVKADIF